MFPSAAPPVSPMDPTSVTGEPPTESKPFDSNRLLLTNPLTGSKVFSCQYEPHLINYPSLHDSIPQGLYSSPVYATPSDSGFTMGLSPEQCPTSFYSSSSNGLDLKENLEAWRTLPYAAAASMYCGYDSGVLSAYPFTNGYTMDLNGARRKNATRETTSTLKAWLNDHRKNPYPTKGEKIMLAIITKMTLTQVSTWFANARRRLKKENKMTWSPRNRCDDNDDEPGSECEDNDDISVDSDDKKCIQDIGEDKSPIIKDSKLPNEETNMMNEKEVLIKCNNIIQQNNKPKIWSLADIAIKDKPKASNELSNNDECCNMFNGWYQSHGPIVAYKNPISRQNPYASIK